MPQSRGALKVTAIVQARMGSTRLPGKVLLDLAGETVLGRVVRRLCRARLIDSVMVATTTAPADDAIATESRRLGIAVFRGSELDVLDRYYHAAGQSAAEVIVRITADCPLIDPEVVDITLKAFLDSAADYASNVLRRSFPRGLDTEVFSFAALQRAWREAREFYEREHVTPFLYGHPEIFQLKSVENAENCSGYRWTLDTEADWQLLQQIYLRFGGRDEFNWRQVVELMEREPELSQLNAHVLQAS